ncbi:MAG: dockerin type I repeat-containing protein [Clostridia bacterium]|nr:dockerin type I repeat-containing protein [Clostridia bacterium]
MKKILSFVLCLIMVFSSIPVFTLVSSAASSSVYIGNVKLESDYFLFSGETEPREYSEVMEEYTYGELEKEGFAYFGGGRLLLHNYEYNGPGYNVSGKRPAAIRAKNILIEISGENEIVCTTDNGVGIYCEGYLQLRNGTLNFFEELAEIDINASFGIMLMDDANSDYNPRYTQNNVDVTINTKGGIGLAVGSEEMGAFVQLYSGSLTINGDNAQSGIAIAAPEGEKRQFSSDVADVMVSGCDYGIYAEDIRFEGGSYICYVVDCGLYAQSGEVNLTESYIDIIVTAVAGNSIKSSMTKVDLKTMYVDFGTVTDNVYVAYPRTYVVVGGVYLYDGDYLETDGYRTTTEKPSTDGYAYYTVNGYGVGVLELNDFEVSESVNFTWGRSGQFEGENACIYSTNSLELVLKGENSITPEQYDYAIAIYGSLTVEGDGSLDIGNDENYSGVLLLGDYATDDITFTMESSSLNIYSECSLSIYCLDYDKDATITVNGGNLFAHFLEADATDDGEGIIEVNGGYVDISGTGTYSNGIGATGYYQNGGIVTIEAIARDYSIINIYNPEDEFGGNFEIYAGEFSIREKNGDSCITTNSLFPVLGHGMAVVEGAWDSAYIRIANESGGTDPDPDPDVPPVVSGKLGDVNNDGKIDQYDYILVKRHYFETRVLSENEALRADVNKDGKVDQYDYILIARHYFGTFVIG